MIWPMSTNLIQIKINAKPIKVFISILIIVLLENVIYGYYIDVCLKLSSKR